ncbi:MAG: phage tail protein, partial [Limnohabitans sp.]
HKELKVFHNGAWVTLFSEDDIKAWIASLSLFEGTAKEEGSTAIGAVEFHLLPNLDELSRTADLSQVSHYWTFIGAPNTPVNNEYNVAGLTGGVPGIYTVTVGGTVAWVRVLTPTTAKVGIQTLDPTTVNGDTVTIPPGSLGTGSSAAAFAVPDITKPATPVIGADLAGAVLNPGDWLQIANRGTAAAPDMHWVTVGGDLLAKARADRLFSLQQWTDGGWERGALVTNNGSIYRAQQPIVAGDAEPGTGAAVAQVSLITITPPTAVGTRYTISVNGESISYISKSGDDAEAVRTGLIAAITASAPFVRIATPGQGAAVNQLSLTATVPGVGFTLGVTATNLTATTTQANVAGTSNPWVKVNLSGGVRWVQLDTDLPVNAPPGELYFVLASATNGGAGRLVYWDGGAMQWREIGGDSGKPLTLETGTPLMHIGCPVGTIIMWASETIPHGWLDCNGQAFSTIDFPELALLFPDGHVPNLHGRFVRSWGPRHPLNYKNPVSWTTGLPRDPFTGYTSTAGDHQHTLERQMGGNGGEWASTNIASGNGNKEWLHTDIQGAHTHSVQIDGGGDTETAPDHVVLGYLIKAIDHGVRLRPDMTTGVPV